MENTNRRIKLPAPIKEHNKEGQEGYGEDGVESNPHSLPRSFDANNIVCAHEPGNGTGFTVGNGGVVVIRVPCDVGVNPDAERRENDLCHPADRRPCQKVFTQMVSFLLHVIQRGGILPGGNSIA